MLFPEQTFELVPLVQNCDISILMPETIVPQSELVVISSHTLLAAIELIILTPQVKEDP